MFLCVAKVEEKYVELKKNQMCKKEKKTDARRILISNAIIFFFTKMTCNITTYSPERIILFNEHRHLVAVRHQYTSLQVKGYAEKRILGNYTSAAGDETLKT